MFTIDGSVFYDVIGVAGFGLYVLNYLLLTFRPRRSENICYFVINGAAATMVLIGLTNTFNLAAAMIQVFFICISVMAIIVRLHARYQAGAAS